ncbi:MAG: NAD(P)-binding domain-containing protein [Planctomycetota bacterium]
MSEAVRTLIVGAGPIGIETAVRLQQRGVDALVVDAGEIGATFGWWAPSTRFFSSPERLAICGVPIVTADQGKCTGEQYRDYLRSVVQQFGVDVRTFTRVVAIDRTADGFAVGLATSAHGVGGPAEDARGAQADRAERTIDVANVVLAIGNMHRARTIGVAGEHLPHVSHYLEDPHRYFGRRVLIVGAKNSAVEAAIRLFRAGAHVTMSYRGEAFDSKRVKYWLKPEIEWLIKQGHIEWQPHTVPVEITTGSVTLAGYDTHSGKMTDARSTVEADDVLLLTGYAQDQSLFETLGITCEGSAARPVHDAATMETNVPGVFVAGTACAGDMTRATHFIENCHVHAERIAAAIAGERAHDADTVTYGVMEES